MDTRRVDVMCVREPGLPRRLHAEKHNNRPMAPVSALLLDVRGVLYDASLWHRWLFQLVSRMGLHTHYATFFRVWQREYLEQVYCGRLEYWDALRQFLATVGFTRSQIAEIEAAGHSRLRAFEDDIRPLPTVPSTLTQLDRQGVTMGILAYAPWTAEVLEEKLRRLRLEGRFSTLLSSYELRTMGPADQFRKAVSELHRQPAEVAYIGQDTRMLAHAREAGLQTLAINYDQDAVADAYLEQFDQLPQIVRFRARQVLAS